MLPHLFASPSSSLSLSPSPSLPLSSLLPAQVSYLYWTPTPSLLLWDASTLFWLQMLFILLHVHTWSCLALSLLSFDHLEFLGLPQVSEDTERVFCVNYAIHFMAFVIGLGHEITNCTEVSFDCLRTHLRLTHCTFILGHNRTGRSIERLLLSAKQ